MSLKTSIIGIFLLFSCNIIYCAQAEEVPVVDVTQDNTINTADLANSSATGSPLSLEQRVAQLEQQLSNRTQVDLLAKINQLQQQIQDLRGQLEVQSHDLKSLQEQQLNRG